MPALRLRHVWVLLTLAATFVIPASASLSIVDLGWTLQAGAWMDANKHLLVDDPFTSAPPAMPQVNAQWLAQLAYYALYRLGGLELVMAGTAAASAAAFAFVLASCLAASGRLRVSCASTLFAFGLGVSNLGARPQTLAYPLFGLFLLTVARAASGRRTRLWWALPPAMAMWANMHGSFILGLVLLGGAALGTLLESRSWRAVRPSLVALGACSFAACLTPYGPGSLLYVAKIGGNGIIRDFLTEWAPTSTATSEGALFFVSVALMGAVVIAGRGEGGTGGRGDGETRGREDAGTRGGVGLTATEWLLLAAFEWLAISSLRAVVWWGLVIAPILARMIGAERAAPGARLRLLTRVIGRWTRGGGQGVARERPLLNGALAASVVLVGTLSLPWFRPINTLLPPSKRTLVGEEDPVAVAAFLSEQAYPGLMLSHANWGGYFDWALWPRHKPFVDTRAELHSPDVWLDYFWITYPTADWAELADRNGIGYLVLSTEHNAGLVDVVRRAEEWQRVYEDDRAVVFVRTPFGASSERPSN